MVAYSAYVGFVILGSGMYKKAKETTYACGDFASSCYWKKP
jgi:hypothetical protein